MTMYVVYVVENSVIIYFQATQCIISMDCDTISLEKAERGKRI